MNRKSMPFQEFQNASQILRQRLRPIKQQDEILNISQGHNTIKNNDVFADHQDNQYLFGDHVDYDCISLKENKELVYSQSISIIKCQTFQPHSNDAIPIKRKASRAHSEPFKQGKATKSKNKYKKQENVGNAMIEEKKFSTIFRSICQPNRNITVNSLGHALQKFKVKFQIKDVVEMLKLLGHNQSQSIENEDELDLKTCLNEEQFKSLYEVIRKKRKN